MNELETIGKKNTILISISILLVSVHTLYLYNSSVSVIETEKIMKQIGRFILTIGLLYFIYSGKNWARIIVIILFSLAVVGATIGLITLNTSLPFKIPLIVTIFIYSLSIYHFAFAKSFKAFFEYQVQKANNFNL